MGIIGKYLRLPRELLEPGVPDDSVCNPICCTPAPRSRPTAMRRCLFWTRCPCLIPPKCMTSARRQPIDAHFGSPTASQGATSAFLYPLSEPRIHPCYQAGTRPSPNHSITEKTPDSGRTAIRRSEQRSNLIFAALPLNDPPMLEEEKPPKCQGKQWSRSERDSIVGVPFKNMRTSRLTTPSSLSSARG